LAGEFLVRGTCPFAGNEEIIGLPAEVLIVIVMRLDLESPSARGAIVIETLARATCRRRNP